MPKDFGTIVQIGDILVSEEVITEYFSCDYATCRGECCISGDAGAPLKECEPGLIERQYPRFRNTMTEGGRDAVDLNGFFEIDPTGDIVTTLVPGSGVCAYACFADDGSCLCSIERCGCTKPVSCSLYPIRVTEFDGGGCALNYHRWDICECARVKGRKDGTRVYQFLEKPLRQVYGDDFYEALCAAAQHVLETED